MEAVTNIWLKVDEAAAYITWRTGKPITVPAVRKRAQRHGWRKQHNGNRTRYNQGDIDNTLDRPLLDFLTKVTQD